MKKRRFKNAEYQLLYDSIWMYWVYPLIVDLSLHTTEDPNFWKFVSKTLKVVKPDDNFIYKIIEDMEQDVRKALRRL